MSTHAQYLVGGMAFYTTACAPYHTEFASDGPVESSVFILALFLDATLKEGKGP